MSKTKSTRQQKQIDADLWIILITTFVVFVIFTVFQKEIYGVIQNEETPILIRVFAGAILQYGLAGLGITIVSVFRKERFSSYGLRKKGMLRSILLCILCFVPYMVFLLVTGQIASYLPFQTVWTTNVVLASGFPTNAIGMLMTANGSIGVPSFVPLCVFSFMERSESRPKELSRCL